MDHCGHAAGLYLGGRLVVGAGSCWPHDLRFLVCFSSFLSVLEVGGGVDSNEVASGEMVSLKSKDSGVMVVL